MRPHFSAFSFGTWRFIIGISEVREGEIFLVAYCCAGIFLCEDEERIAERCIKRIELQNYDFSLF